MSRAASVPGKRPEISVVVPLKVPDVPPDVDALVNRFAVSALRLLQRVGANCRVVDVSNESRPDVDEVVRVDGVVLLGGGDLDPELYGRAHDEVPNLYGVDRAADDYTLDLIRAAERAGTPTLAICRGAQLLNFAFGGTVIPDIEEWKRHRGGPGDPMFLDETVLVQPGSWLERVYRRERLVVRNGHHQAVDRPAPGFSVAALAEDGIVEAIEATTGWACWGVQWHPEDLDGAAGDAETLFADFLDHCRAGVKM